MKLKIMESEFKDKIILVTGGTGTIGSELVTQLLKYSPKQIRVLSRNETRQYYLLEKLKHPKNLRMLIGDIRDKDRLNLAFEDVDIVFHSAALKHVPFCEYNPHEAVKTNIFGSQNVLDAAIKHKVKKVIAISTDKVANPFNILGTSKLMMEKLVINSNLFLWGKIKFSCVRFGNVAWSAGSVLPLWKKRAETEGIINVTNKNATRFFMSTEQAVNLTIKAAELSQGGEIFILKMPSIKLIDLAKIFLNKYFPDKKIKIKETGSRAGDKVHEYLVGDNDWTARVLVNKEMIILTPATYIYNLEQTFPVYKGFKKIRNIKLLNTSSKNNINLKEISKII